jgi:hypothetical protein
VLTLTARASQVSRGADADEVTRRVRTALSRRGVRDVCVEVVGVSASTVQAASSTFASPLPTRAIVPPSIVLPASATSSSGAKRVSSFVDLSLSHSTDDDDNDALTASAAALRHDEEISTGAHAHRDGEDDEEDDDDEHDHGHSHSHAYGSAQSHAHSHNAYVCSSVSNACHNAQ